MGKTKTVFVSGVDEEEKTSAQKYKEKKERQAKEAKEKEKIHISGLKGGQRIKVIEAQQPTQTTTEAKPEEKKGKAKKIKVRSKKYKGAKKNVDSSKSYNLKEAVVLVKKTSYSVFDGTVELHLIVKKTGTQANVSLPYSSGKQKKVEVADEKTIEKLEKGKIDFDILLATTDMMPKLVAFAKILGPKGLMPNPKNGTIIRTAKDAQKFKGNSINLKTEREAPIIHTSVGKVSQKEEELEKNIQAVLEALGGNKQIVKAFVKATMGPSIKLAIS